MLYRWTCSDDGHALQLNVFCHSIHFATEYALPRDAFCCRICYVARHFEKISILYRLAHIATEYVMQLMRSAAGHVLLVGTFCWCIILYDWIML